MNNWNATLYDGKHAFVSELGQSVVTLLQPGKDEKILDLGCGTGDLTNQISQAGAQVVGIDSSSAMIQKAQQKYPHLEFQVADANNLTFGEQFDAVFSNAALHWIKPPEVVLKNIWSALKPGGRFVAELGGQGNVASIIGAIHSACITLGVDANLLESPWYFPSLGEYTSLMEKTGFRVVSAWHFDRPTPLSGANGLKDWITMFGGSLLANLPKEVQNKIIETAEASLRDILLKENVWLADYKRLRVVGVKKASAL